MGIPNLKESSAGLASDSTEEIRHVDLLSSIPAVRRRTELLLRMER